MKSKLISISVFIALILNLSACSSNNDLLKIKTVPAKTSAIEASVDISGVLAPVNTVNVSSKIGGRVENVNIEVGKEVKAGDILITLDKTDIEAQVKQAELAYEAAVSGVEQNRINLEAAASALESTKKTLPEQGAQSDVALKTAEKNLDTAQKGITNAQTAVSNAELSLETATKRLDNVTILYKSGVSSKTEMDTAQTQYDSAVNQLESAKNQLEIATNQFQISSNAYESAKSQYKLTTGATADSQLSAAQSKYDAAKASYETSQTIGVEQAKTALEIAKLQLDNTTIVSPVDGIVVNINPKQGEMIGAGTSLAVISDISSLKLNGTVSQESYVYLKKGDALDVTVDAVAGKTYPGVISSAGPVAVSAGNYFPIEITIESDGVITAGYSARGTLKLNSDSGIVVPASAVVKNNGETYVFIIRNGVAAKRTVMLGLQNETQVMILSGLNEGDMAAVTNVNSLFDGMMVDVEN